MVASMIHEQDYIKYVLSDNLYTTNPLQKMFYEQRITGVGTVRCQNLPKMLKPVFTAFKKLKYQESTDKRIDPKSPTKQLIPIVNFPYRVYKYGNVFYIFWNDNVACSVSTNNAELIE